MRARPLAALALALCALPGCGNDRIEGVGLVREASSRSREHRLPALGMSFELPANVKVRRSARPGAFRGELVEAFVSGFAYRRREQLPRNRRELEAARKRLTRAVKKRASGYGLISSRRERIGGAGAIALLGDQTISQRRLRTRSLHLFKGSAEYVIEVAAPVGQFERFDRAVTPLLRRTLKVTGKLRARR